MKKVLLTLGISISFISLIGQTPSSTKELAQSPKSCFAVSFSSPGQFLQSPISLTPGNGVVIGGVNFNVPTRNLTIIKNTLQGGATGNIISTPQQNLNQEFAAAQLSLIKAGGLSSPTVFSALNNPIICYGVNLPDPVTLSNGVTISSGTTLRDFLDQTRLTVIDSKRFIDAPVLAYLLRLFPCNSARSGGRPSPPNPNCPFDFGGSPITCCAAGGRCVTRSCPSGNAKCGPVLNGIPTVLCE
ncbi:MAG: hypothetical protein JST85_22980 [Acidobacteria bacterium]|nr:hypothetical protein [Acidobacteriota bacterium]